jgi:hypothetical protein
VGDDWAEQRRRSIAAHAAAAERKRAAEIAQAREMIDEFVRAARSRGVKPVTLTARAYNGGGTYRTNRQGWYISVDRSVAIGTDGGYYVLSVPASLRARFTGASVDPQDPRLIVGEGARDGESMPLKSMLQMRLDAGNDWP